MMATNPAVARKACSAAGAAALMAGDALTGDDGQPQDLQGRRTRRDWFRLAELSVILDRLPNFWQILAIKFSLYDVWCTEQL